MASVQTRGIVLSQTATFGSKKQELVATQVGVRYKRDPQTHQPTEDIDGYNINVRAPRTGEIQTVKLPVDIKPVIDKIDQALKEDLIPWVSFNGTFRAKFWAMLGDTGRVTTGVSATATSLEVVKVEDLDDDEFDSLDDIIE